MDTKPKDRPTDVELEKAVFRALSREPAIEDYLLTAPHP